MIIKGKKYLITGGTGVVGYKLCERILGMGGEVRVLSHGEDNLKKLKDKYNEIELVCGDISNQQDVRDAMIDIRGVVHLAAVAEGMQAGKPLISIQTNIIGSIKVLLESTETTISLNFLKYCIGSSPIKLASELESAIIKPFEFSDQSQLTFI